MLTIEPITKTKLIQKYCVAKLIFIRKIIIIHQETKVIKRNNDTIK